MSPRSIFQPLRSAHSTSAKWPTPAAVVMAVGKNNTKFIGLACINIVVAANAGGAFSPFGDITTLMVWQKGVVTFTEFFYIFVPSVVNYIVPAAIMHFAIGNEKPEESKEKVTVKYGGYTVIFLFLGTITFTVIQHQFLHLPPVFGMMTGLGVLSIYGYHLKIKESKDKKNKSIFNIFNMVSKAEWDTLLFFYGVLMCVGGLSAFGYMLFTSFVILLTSSSALKVSLAFNPAFAVSDANNSGPRSPCG